VVVLRWKKLGCGLRSEAQRRKWEWIIHFVLFSLNCFFLFWNCGGEVRTCFALIFHTSSFCLSRLDNRFLGSKLENYRIFIYN